MVPGAVAAERIMMFRAMKYHKNPKRNSLKEEHLTACARVFKSKEFSIASFPIEKCLDDCNHKCYGLDR
eukprot:1158304-Pelagomonas_calceolata.AAC.7